MSIEELKEKSRQAHEATDIIVRAHTEGKVSMDVVNWVFNKAFEDHRKLAHAQVKQDEYYRTLRAWRSLIPWGRK